MQGGVPYAEDDGDHGVLKGVHGHGASGTHAGKAAGKDQHRGDDGKGGCGAFHLFPLSFKICCLWKRFDAQHHVGGRGASEAATAARLFFEFCLSMREVSDLLYATGHQNCILDAYLRILRPDEDTEDELEYYRSNMTAYALYGLVNAWILRGYRETPAEMERIVRDWIAASREAQGKA